MLCFVEVSQGVYTAPSDEIVDVSYHYYYYYFYYMCLHYRC